VSGGEPPSARQLKLPRPPSKAKRLYDEANVCTAERPPGQVMT